MNQRQHRSARAVSHPHIPGSRSLVALQEVKLGLSPSPGRAPAMAEVRTLAGGESLLQGLVGFAEGWLREECLATFRDTKGAAVALNPFFEVRGNPTD